MATNDILGKKTYKFALDVVFLCRDIMSSKTDFILSGQCMRSATSIGANVSEAKQSESRKDFISKLSIAIKEGYETRYWLLLINDTHMAPPEQIRVLLGNLDEILALLGASIRTAKHNLKKKI